MKGSQKTRCKDDFKACIDLLFIKKGAYLTFVQITDLLLEVAVMPVCRATHIKLKRSNISMDFPSLNVQASGRCALFRTRVEQ